MAKKKRPPLSEGRRKFMATGIFAMTGGIAAIGSATLARFGVGSAFEKKKSKWIVTDINPDDLTSDTFEQTIIEFDTKDGWVTASSKALAYVRKNKNNEIVAISATCTHLGCVVSWNEETNSFKCPCHSGTYDPEGVVLSGPPPAALWRHVVKIDEGRLLLSSQSAPAKGEGHASV